MNDKYLIKNTFGKTVTEFCFNCGKFYSYYSNGISEIFPSERIYHGEGKCIENKDIPFYIKTAFIIVLIIGIVIIIKKKK